MPMSATEPDAFERVEPMVVDGRSLANQLTARLRELISSGVLGGGAQLPTETELAERFRVGRTTVREALKQLENEGAVVVRRGRGRFVSTVPVLHRPITRLESVTKLLAGYGYDVQNRVLHARRRAPSDDEQEQLRLRKGADVFSLERIRLHADEALIYSVDVLPAERLEPLQHVDWTGSLGDVLSAKRLLPLMSVTTIRAAQLEPEIAAACGTDPGLPWLLMIQLNLLEDGSPIIYSHDYHRGDRFSFDVRRHAEDMPA
jgi:GntR family transcriptional regulator